MHSSVKSKIRSNDKPIHNWPLKLLVVVFFLQQTHTQRLQCKIKLTRLIRLVCVHLRERAQFRTGSTSRRQVADALPKTRAKHELAQSSAPYVIHGQNVQT